MERQLRKPGDGELHREVRTSSGRCKSYLRSFRKDGEAKFTPFVGNFPNLRLISPVPQQSRLELDLPTKFGALSVLAHWTNPEWDTYTIRTTFC